MTQRRVALAWLALGCGAVIAGCGSAGTTEPASAAAAETAAAATAVVAAETEATTNTPAPSPASTEAPAAVSPAPAATPTPTPAAQPTAAPTATSTPVPAATATATATAVPATPTPAAPPCQVIDDFTGEARWQLVLDGVMGGRSTADAAVMPGRLVVDGTIDTNGGGFVMVRRAIDPALLAGATSLRIEAITDGRRYELIADDALPGRQRSVSLFAPIPFRPTGAGDAGDAGTVEFTSLVPRSFGNPIAGEGFRPDLATSIGVILSDGIDGDFRLEITAIAACT